MVSAWCRTKEKQYEDVTSNILRMTSGHFQRSDSGIKTCPSGETCIYLYVTAVNHRLRTEKRYLIGKSYQKKKNQFLHSDVENCFSTEIHCN